MPKDNIPFKARTSIALLAILVSLMVQLVLPRAATPVEAPSPEPTAGVPSPVQTAAGVTQSSEDRSPGPPTTSAAADPASPTTGQDLPLSVATPAVLDTPVTPAPSLARDAPSLQPVAPIYWGVNMPRVPWDMDKLRAWEANVAGKAVSIVNYGHFWGDGSAEGYREFSWSVPLLNNIRSHGAIPMISWTPEGGDPGRWQLKKIIDGEHDDYIRHFAQGLRDWPAKDDPAPVFLRIMHEMNGNWDYPWQEDANGNQRGEFVQAWRHIVDIFRQEQVTNATLVWCPNVEEYGSDWPSFASLYPEDAEHPNNVDWTCLDGYNWGGSRWKTFDQVFRHSYDSILSLEHAASKPMMVGEWGSVEQGAPAGASKAGWATDVLTVQIPHRYKQIRALVYYNFEEGPYNWQIETSDASRDAFRAGIAAPHYTSNDYGDLREFPIPVPDDPR